MARGAIGDFPSQLMWKIAAVAGDEGASETTAVRVAGRQMACAIE